MKRFLKNFRAHIGNLNHMTIMFLLVGMSVTQDITGQDITDPCKQGEYIFKGEKEATLCDQYGNITCGIQVGVGTSITHSSQIGTSYTGNVCVKGDFKIDKSFKFVNCVIKIDPGVTISVLSPPNQFTSILFTIDNSKLFACEEMWNGIVLSKNTNIRTTNGTIIEDALTSIKAENVQYANLFIDHTTFNRNDIGILLSQGHFATNGPTLVTFDANTFSCTAPLNGTLNQIGYAGIKTKDVPFTVNPAIAALVNKFIGIQYGIRAEGVNTTISGSYFQFENISRDGIYMDMGILNLAGSHFTNCQEKGINIALAQNLRLTRCVFIYDEALTDPGAFNNARDGVFVQAFGVGSKCTVVGSNFIANLTTQFKNINGLHFAGGNVGSGTHIVVHQSSWNFVAVSSHGILLPGTFPNDSGIEIYNNTFDIKLPYNSPISYAIRCLDGDKHNLDIIGNTFTNAGDTPGWETGIHLRGSEGAGNDVSDNDFPPPAILLSFLPGIGIEDFKNTIFCSNTFYNTNIAFTFSGQNDNTDLVANACYATSMLQIVGPSWIEDQLHKGNTWATAPGSLFVTTIHASMTNPSFAPFSQFRVHTPQSTANSGTGFSPYHPKDIVPDVDDEWWKMEEGTPESACIEELTGGGGVSRLKMDIADGLIGDVLESAPLEWQAKRGLYRTLMKNPELVDQYPSFTTFLSVHSGSVIGKLYEVSSAIETALKADETLLLSVGENQNNLDNLLAELLDIDLNLSNTTDASTNDAAFQAKSEKLQQLLEIVSNLNTYNQEYRMGVTAAIGGIRILNNTIETSTTWESNEKTVNDIYLNKVETGTLTEEQIEALTEIGQKCPQESGMIVYMARGLLPGCIRSLISDYIECYPTSEEVESVLIEERSSENIGQSSLHNTDKTMVYPNPTTGEVQIRLPEGQTAYVVVTDSFGKSMMKAKVVSLGTIKLDGLVQGLYSIKVHLDGATPVSHRILLIK